MMIERIREASHSGWPLGSEDFLDGIEQQFGVKVRKARPGPQPGRTTDSFSTASAQLALFATSQFGS